METTRYVFVLDDGRYVKDIYWHDFRPYFSFGSFDEAVLVSRQWLLTIIEETGETHSEAVVNRLSKHFGGDISFSMTSVDCKLYKGE